ncbi:MAG TPA: hypothetical protein VNT75_29505 [Symbiobacteriaceae bacterium]|nr:hypothetical protein [Symbiobacteriaceae bacterium]
MANTNVFTGADGSLTLAVDQSEAGKSAQGIMEAFALTGSVGRVTDVSVQIHTDVRPFHELGQRYASELRAGNVSITGTVGRAYVNGALLSLLLGDVAKPGSDAAGSAFMQPTFNMVLNLSNSAVPGVQSVLTLYGVKFTTWNISLPEDDFVMESVQFRALRATVTDELPG